MWVIKTLQNLCERKTRKQHWQKSFNHIFPEKRLFSLTKESDFLAKKKCSWQSHQIFRVDSRHARGPANCEGVIIKPKIGNSLEKTSDWGYLKIWSSGDPVQQLLLPNGVDLHQLGDRRHCRHRAYQKCVDCLGWESKFYHLFIIE